MAGDLLYLSGNIGTDPATGKPPAAFGDASRQSLKNLGRVLKAAGLGWEDVVKVNVYVKDMGRYEEFNGIYTAALPRRSRRARSWRSRTCRVAVRSRSKRWPSAGAEPGLVLHWFHVRGWAVLRGRWIGLRIARRAGRSVPLLGAAVSAS